MNIRGELRYYIDGDHARMTYSEGPNSLSIDTILVPSIHRGRKVGTKLVERVLMLADAQRKDVYLSARPIGSSGEEALERLVRFYQRFDFEETDRGLTVVHMRRLRR